MKHTNTVNLPARVCEEEVSWRVRDGQVASRQRAATSRPGRTLGLLTIPVEKKDLVVLIVYE